MKKTGTFSKVYIALILAVIYIPIVMVIIYSFNTSKINAVWEGFSLKWYSELLRDKDIMKVLKNSLILATVSSLNAAVIGTLGALGLSKLEFKLKGLLDYAVSIPLMTPEIILGIAFLSFFTILSIPAGFTALMLAHTTFCVPYVYMMVKARLVGLDQSYAEAARDLGANNFRAFWDITLPSIMPAVFSGMMLAFAMSMDDVVISSFLTGPRFDTLPVKIYSQLKTTISPKYNALGTLMFMVTILLFLTSVIIGRSNKLKKLSKEGK